jgi:hypothetical protein
MRWLRAADVAVTELPSASAACRGAHVRALARSRLTRDEAAAQIEARGVA